MFVIWFVKFLGLKFLMYVLDGTNLNLTFNSVYVNVCVVHCKDSKYRQTDTLQLAGVEKSNAKHAVSARYNRFFCKRKGL